MSDTTEAAVARLRQDSSELRAVLQDLQRGGPSAPTLVGTFAELFFSKAPPTFLKERPVPALSKMVRDTYAFVERARPDRVDVEVLAPEDGAAEGGSRSTMIRTNLSERPFIVDTIREYLSAEGLAVGLLIYPVLQVVRDGAGAIERIAPSRDGGTRESVVYCEISPVTDGDRLRALEEGLKRRLEDVLRVTEDFEPMRSAVDEALAELDTMASALPDRAEEIREVKAFLLWLREGGFVFLGHRSYELIVHEGKAAVQVQKGTGLGILRDEGASAFAAPVPVQSLPAGLQRALEGGNLLILSKTNSTSTVHRRARMDYIGVKRLDASGRVVGERRFMGLFTSGAYAERSDKIPILRKKLARIVEDFGVVEGTHDYKEIHSIFNSLPKEELFITPSEEIATDIRTVLTTFDSGEVRVGLRRDPLHRGVSVMVILAKERFSGEVRKRIEEALVEALQGEVLNYHLALGEGEQARLHFYLSASPEAIEAVDSLELEAMVRTLTRSWGDRVRAGLEAVRPAEEARQLARQFNEAFPAEYRAATDPALAVTDLLEIEAMRAEGRTLAIALRNPDAVDGVAGGESVTELKLHLRGERLVLSDFFPILEDCGLRVISVTPFEIQEPGEVLGHLYSFLVQRGDRSPIDIEEAGERLATAILAVRTGDASSCPLNALVLSAGLDWREVEVLRSYAAYAFQAGAVPSRLSLPNALLKHPKMATLLFSLFRVRFDPEGPSDRKAREKEEKAILRKIREELTQVTVLSEDRALRKLQNLIQNTLRTNFYRTGGSEPTMRSGGVPYISLKFDASRIEAAEPSRLRYEVWVRSSRMEGIHLRGAKVARGGIRWSDRPDDFRTEVLGLVKTQMVKNAVIVPAGSKGGFVTLRSLPAEAMADEGREQYKTLVRGLLDITDNLKGTETLPPPGVVCWDDPDPYLVVAADKGTAKFSDVANAVSAEYDFWLGDAFASGGSIGYDHKEVGITAAGAWECVKRHFLEEGKDIQAEPFTVVGIGDMSGDVFGNGMLLSRQILLLAAFDHRDIFLDPNPDPARSWEERNRLFALGRSSWQDYDASLLSEGGMIVPRGSKEILLTPQIREALGIEEEGPLDGETLIRMILTAPVELLWNGGIGTYVKASFETHAQVGDATNDAVRVSAADLRCRVVGEGGNLGFTQRARIEFALQGGRINTDAIDNSGGVDLSDREVNLKILLRLATDDGVLTLEARNALLRELQDEVATLVLRDNEGQGLAISLDEHRAAGGLDDFRQLISGLERAGVMDRAAEALPGWEELAERQEEGQSITRPELSVLLAYAKLQLTSHLLQSSVPEDPVAQRVLRAYFPARALEVVGEARAAQHRLQREIVASQLAGDLVNIMGAGFVQRMVRGTGGSPAEVARAWLVASELTGYPALFEALRMGRTSMPIAVVYRWLRGLSRVLERTTRWLLAVPDFPEKETAEALAEYRDGLDRLRIAFPELVTGEDRRIFEALAAELEADGTPEATARELVTLRFLDHLLEILRVHRGSGADPLDVARTFYQVADRFRIPKLQEAVSVAAGDDRWERRAAESLQSDLARAHQRLADAILKGRSASVSVDEAFETLLQAESAAMARYDELAEEMDAEERLGLPALTVAVRELLALSRRFEGR